MDYYLAIDGQRQGPFSLDELRRQDVSLQTLVWHQGMTEWRPAVEVLELHEICQFPPLLPTPPPPLPSLGAATRPHKNHKVSLVGEIAGLVCLVAIVAAVIAVIRSFSINDLPFKPSLTLIVVGIVAIRLLSKWWSSRH